MFNLGHCHRKLGSLDDAVSCYLRARELSPHRHSVHSALALTYHLQVRLLLLLPPPLLLLLSLLWCLIAVFVV